MRARFGAVASCVAWITFIGLYALSVVPFIQAGLQYVPSPFESTGRDDYFNIPYTWGPIYVYGSKSTADMASWIMLIAPCLYLSVPIIIFWQIINHWYEDSQNRRRAKTLRLLLSLVMLVFSTVMAFNFVEWTYD